MRGCCQFIGITTTACPLRVLLQGCRALVGGPPPARCRDVSTTRKSRRGRRCALVAGPPACALRNVAKHCIIRSTFLVAWGSRVPTILRIGPYRFFFYAGDGVEPAHVHVERDDSIAKFWLDPVRLHSSGGFTRIEIARLTGLVNEHRTNLLEAWNAYFND